MKNYNYARLDQNLGKRDKRRVTTSTWLQRANGKIQLGSDWWHNQVKHFRPYIEFYPDRVELYMKTREFLNFSPNYGADISMQNAIDRVFSLADLNAVYIKKAAGPWMEAIQLRAFDSFSRYSDSKWCPPSRNGYVYTGEWTPITPVPPLSKEKKREVDAFLQKLKEALPLFSAVAPFNPEIQVPFKSIKEGYAMLQHDFNLEYARWLAVVVYSFHGWPSPTQLQYFRRYPRTDLDEKAWKDITTRLYNALR